MNKNGIEKLKETKIRLNKELELLLKQEAYYKNSFPEGTVPYLDLNINTKKDLIIIIDSLLENE